MIRLHVIISLRCLFGLFANKDCNVTNGCSVLTLFVVVRSSSCSWHTVISRQRQTDSWWCDY